MKALVKGYLFLIHADKIYALLYIYSLKFDLLLHELLKNLNFFIHTNNRVPWQYTDLNHKTFAFVHYMHYIVGVMLRVK